MVEFLDHLCLVVNGMVAKWIGRQFDGVKVVMVWVTQAIVVVLETNRLNFRAFNP